MARFPPARIVCLSAETVETLYAIGAADRIVGVTGYAVRPARVRREKPRVAAFSSADVGKVLALAPDLVLAFSDVQAEIAAALVRAGVAVHVFNQRDLAGILAMIRLLGRMVDAAAAADALADDLQRNLDAVRARGARRARRPRVYVEEWDEPMTAGIGWFSEIVEAAGGIDVFADRAHRPAARERAVSLDAAIAAAPEIVIASWCGKRFAPDRFRARPGFAALPAVRDGRLHEVKSALVLAPGPAVLTDGLAAVEAIVAAFG